MTRIHRRRGLILPVVLVVVGLLAVLMATFIFFVRAEATAAVARRDAQQAELAAESGLEEAILIIREAPNDPAAWWNVPERFRNTLVWAETFMRDQDPVRRMGSRKELLEQAVRPVAWRYSVVGQELDGPVETIRYGVTPEASKLNLNTATEEEIQRLFTEVLASLNIENAAELIDAFLDWRDEDKEQRASGAEDEYYNTLQPPYLPKNGRLTTVEELLLIKGFTAGMLYGEDVNRNGLLDENEDDGNASFPEYDNGDGKLDRGLWSYVTVWSREAGQPGGSGGPGGSGPGGVGPPSTQPGAGGSGGPSYREGRVHVYTASDRVLRALGMPPEVAAGIVAMRQTVPEESRGSLAWIDAAGPLDPQIKNRLTTKALQFHIEVIGYADHTQVASRHEWIVELRGKIGQVLYHRDLTEWGLAWPVDNDDFLQIQN